MFSTLKAYAYAFIAALVAVAGVVLYGKGRKDASNENTIQEQDDYIHTRKQMDDADIGPSDDDVAEWLRKRGGKRGGGL